MAQCNVSSLKTIICQSLKTHRNVIFIEIYLKSVFNTEKKKNSPIFSTVRKYVYLQAIHVHSQIREALTGHVRGWIETLTWPSKQVLLSGIGLWDEENSSVKLNHLHWHHKPPLIEEVKCRYSASLTCRRCGWSARGMASARGTSKGLGGMHPRKVMESERRKTDDAVRSQRVLAPHPYPAGWSLCSQE